ncbi:MAG: hypothetical protein AB7R69_03095 [Candidatus Babeliales bacterium]
MKWILSKNLTVALLFTSSLVSFDVEEYEENHKKDISITILVHGIISVAPYINFSNIIKFMQDKIANTTYSRSIEQTRRDPYFYQHHPMQELGLRKIDRGNNRPGAAATAYAQLLDMLAPHPNKSIEHHYYTFGWSGLLSPRIRYLEAKIFYDQMLKEFEHFFNNDHYNVKIHIIGYSHGANVALKLAEVYKKEGYDKTKKIIVDELILMGAPILPETDYLLNSSLFKKVYHFYSYGDRVQRLDFFSLDRVFSNRKFHDRSDFSVPEKIVQINIKIKRATKGRKNPSSYSLEELIHRRSTQRNSDPGHTELWSFGWSPASYRDTFPLYPLPVGVFIPVIISKLQETMPDAKNLMVELHPDYEAMLFYDFDKKYEKITPFVDKKTMCHLKTHAEQFRPDESFNRLKYEKKVKKSIRQANKEQFGTWKERRASCKKTKGCLPVQECPQC